MGPLMKTDQTKLNKMSLHIVKTQVSLVICSSTLRAPIWQLRTKSTAKIKSSMDAWTFGLFGHVPA